jgi:hypothetical protein
MFFLILIISGTMSVYKGEQCTAELGANTDANHTCTKFFWNFFRQIFFFLMLSKEYVFVSRNFLLLRKLKKGRWPNLCQLFTYAGPMSTLVEPNQMILAILIDQLQ